MKLNYATPQAKDDRPPACHPAVAVIGIVVYGTLTAALALLILVIVGMHELRGAGTGVEFEQLIVSGVSFLVAVFCGWRTIDAMGEFRRRRKKA